MIKSLLALVLTFSTFFLFAQTPASTGSITGLVLDSASNAPLGYVTVSVIDPVTKLAAKSTLSKDDGSFIVNNLALKSYNVSVASVGYQSKIIVVSGLSSTQPLADLGKILLSASNGQLKEVTISAAKPLVTQEIDRVSYDVQADPDSKAQSAMDMLRKVPLVTVDGDDNIQLQGSGSYKIFINGKPSALMASSPKDVLKSMSANTIQKIEVITTPPAKYDSEGLAGIINIITTQKTENGYNGTLSARHNDVWGPNLNLTGTAKRDKIGLSGYVGGGRQTFNTVSTDNLRSTYATASNFFQDGTNSFGGNFFYSTAELSYELDTLNLLTASANFNKGRFDQDYERLTLFDSELSGSTLQSYHLFNDGGFNWQGNDLSLNYQLGFKKSKQRLLTASYRYSYSLNGQFSNITAQDRINYDNPDSKQQNDAGIKEHTFQLDYVHPFKKVIVEGGVKGILRENYSETVAQVLQNSNGEEVFMNDPARTNVFTYHQNVYSIYNSYTYKAADWTFKGGVRMEQTHVDANFISNNSNLNRNYTNVVPSISIMRSLKKNQSLTLGYTNRIERPAIYQLNPFVDKSNPQVLFTGNPNLRPLLSNLFELSYTRSGSGSFSTRVSYMYTGNSIENVIRLISDSLSETSYQNIGTNKILRLNINGNYPTGKKLNLNVSTGIFHVWLSGMYNGQLYNNQGFRTNSSINTTYKPGKDWQFGVSGGFNSRYINLQGGSNDYIFSSVTAAKSFLDKKLSITAVVNNPFKKHYPFINYSDTPDFYQSNTRNGFYRTFNFNLSYKFGKLSSDIKKNQRSINNDDVSKSNVQ